jgi:hypothetical protein
VPTLCNCMAQDRALLLAPWDLESRASARGTQLLRSTWTSVDSYSLETAATVFDASRKKNDVIKVDVVFAICNH